MGLWIDVLQAFAAAITPSQNAKVQIRFPGEAIWRDVGFVATNTDSLQGALDQFGTANPSANVRATDTAGRVLDFR